MGVVYTGRYRYASGLKNFSAIPETVPALAANETVWLEVPQTGGNYLSAVAENHLAVVVRSEVWQSNAYVYGPPSVFVYALDSKAVPNKLIAEIPCPNSNYHIIYNGPRFSPDGRYMTIIWTHKTNSALTMQYCYEIMEDSVEEVPFRAMAPRNTSERWEWLDDNYYCYIGQSTTFNQNAGNYDRLMVSSRSNPLVVRELPQTGQMPGTNLYNGDFMVREFIANGNPSWVWSVYNLDKTDPLNPLITKLRTLDGDIVATSQPTVTDIMYHNVGNGYIVKQYIAVSGGGYVYDLYHYSSGLFTKLDALPAGSVLSPESKFAPSGNLVTADFNTYTDLGVIRQLEPKIGMFVIESMKDVPSVNTIRGSSPGTIKGVHYSALRNRVIVIEDSGVRSYGLAPGGFKLPTPPVNPRFVFDLNANFLPSKALYTVPAATFTGTTPSVVVANGIPAIQIANGQSASINTLNLFDFGCERGFMHFWYRVSNSGDNRTMFAFGPYAITATPQGSPLLNKWNHYLLAWDRNTLKGYSNGHSGSQSVNAKKRPVKDFNNKLIMFGNPTNVNTFQMRDLSFHEGDDCMQFFGNESSFVPPKWAEFRANASWPAYNDGAMAPRTPLLTPKFS